MKIISRYTGVVFEGNPGTCAAWLVEPDRACEWYAGALEGMQREINALRGVVALLIARDPAALAAVAAAMDLRVEE